MKNSIFKIKKFILLIFITTFLFNNYSLSEDFFFEGTEIQILENGDKLKSDKGVKITTSNDMIITADKFEYDKIKLELTVDGNVILKDNINETTIKTNKIKYFKNLEQIFTYDKTLIDIDENIAVVSKNIIFYKNKNQIKSNSKTEVKDRFGNTFYTEEFFFNLNNKVLKAKDVTIKDLDNNEYFLKSFFADLSKNNLYGKDIKVIFSSESFGNKENNPRLYGNIFESNKSESVISKGIFTTCKKRDGCPPWVLKADRVVHDKKKKIINYQNAWLEVYDKPIIYFPKFFHPDPTVKRQSGFLIPQFNDSGNTGTSVQIPYFKVLAENEDMTLKPTFFTNNNIILQNEYRKVEKNLKHTSDFSLFTSLLGDGEQTSKSHFFSNTEIELDDIFFGSSNLEINIEQVTNDTYLKKYKLNSPLIESETLMHSFIQYDGYNDNSSSSISMEVYENLTQKSHDRYEVILPNLTYSRDLESDFDLQGSLSFDSNLFQKQYETNKYQLNLNNSLVYSSPKKFSKNGLVKDFKLRLLNPNERLKTGYEGESKSKNQLLSQFMYSLTYPLKKQSTIGSSFITPGLSYRFSPNMTKNLSNKDRILDITNINSFDRLSENDAVEGGHSITAGIGYKKNDLSGNEKVSLELAQVVSDGPNPDLPNKTTLNKKYSDIIGNLKFKINDILNFDYSFMLDDGLNKSNFNSIKTSLTLNNLVTTFEYLEEGEIIGTNHYVGNETTLKLNNNNSLAFKTRSNREIDLTEFYNLVYQYENDCLRAALEYNKTYYSDSDIKPEEELLFSLTIIPFSKVDSTNLK